MQLVISLILLSLLAIFLVYATLALLHARKFAYLSTKTKTISVMFTIAALIFTISSLGFLFSVDWENW